MTSRDNPAAPAAPPPGADLEQRPDLASPAPPPGALAERIQYAKALAGARLLPRAYQDQPANVLLAMEWADALGLRPMAVIQSLHVIDGKPTASADLIAALVRRAGHLLRVRIDNPGTAEATAVAELVRSDDRDFVFTATWTLPRARQAGLLTKDNWARYPDAMLKRRATSEVARDACPEVLSGLWDQDDTPLASRWPEQSSPPDRDDDGYRP